MSEDRARIRNIGIAAHIDAGKTTTTERILYYTGRTHRMGEVDEGTTTTDFDEQEQERGITIYSVAVSCPWRDCTINLIDTPGHVDFTAEVERLLRVLDGMVAVFSAREGVEAQSETVWRQASKYRIPRVCFINKMDRIGASFENVVKAIRGRLHGNPIPIQMPMGESETFAGVVDLINMRAIHYTYAISDSRFEPVAIPDEYLAEAKIRRNEMIEAIAEVCESLMDKFLGEEEITAKELIASLRAATIAGAAHPVLCGSSLRFMGVQPLLDAVCDFLPSPLDVPPIEAHSAKDPEKTVLIKCDPKGHMAALVFKVIADKPVDLCFARVYSGTLKANARVLNVNVNEKENVSRIYQMFAKRREQRDQAQAGDIVALIGPRHTLTGHTICDTAHPVLLEAIEFPETVISVAIEPKSSKDRDKLDEALRALCRQDPTLTVSTHPDTGQILLSGMGELHLEVNVHRLKREMNVDAAVGPPQVTYRETITASAEAEGKCMRQIGGKDHFAIVRVRIEPNRHGHTEIIDNITAGSIEPEYLTAIRAGVQGAAQVGPLGSYPVIDWKVTLLSGQQHDSDSSEIAFENAARDAFYSAMALAEPRLLQPIMAAEIVTPEEYLGTIIGDLNQRDAEITETQMRGPETVVQANVPLPGLFGYITRLRSLSQGRATASISPSHFAPVPEAQARKLLG